MNRTTLIAKMRAQNPGMTTADAGKAIDAVFPALREVVEAGNYVRIPGFGTFKRKFRDTTKRRNPRTGETVMIPAHHVITFKEAKPKK